MDPTSTATGAAMSGAPTTGAGVGVMALLSGWFGVQGANVTMVLMAAVIGCFFSMQSATKDERWLSTAGFMLCGIGIAFLCSWMFASILVGYVPAVDRPELPALFALAIGVLSRRIPKFINSLATKGEKQIGIDEGEKK